jgi:hypothetical protein
MKIYLIYLVILIILILYSYIHHNNLVQKILSMLMSFHQEVFDIYVLNSILNAHVLSFLIYSFIKTISNDLIHNNMNTYDYYLVSISIQTIQQDHSIINHIFHLV